MNTSVLREGGPDIDVATVIHQLEVEMQEASIALEFERAALLRDQIKELKGQPTGRTYNLKPMERKKVSFSKDGGKPKGRKRK